MKNISLFASDKIRMHPNVLTSDGLGIATGPYHILPLDAPDEELASAIRECLEHSGNEAPSPEWQEEESTVYYQNLGVNTQKDLGRGVDIVEEDGAFTLTPIDSRGLFGEPVDATEAELLEVIKEMVGLIGVRVV